MLGLPGPTRLILRGTAARCVTGCTASWCADGPCCAHGTRLARPSELRGLSRTQLAAASARTRDIRTRWLGRRRGAPCHVDRPPSGFGPQPRVRRSTIHGARSPRAPPGINRWARRTVRGPWRTTGTDPVEGFRCRASCNDTLQSGYACAMLVFRLIAALVRDRMPESRSAHGQPPVPFLYLPPFGHHGLGRRWF